MVKKKDDLGDRMKMYERREGERFMNNLPIIVRLDGRGFSKFTRDMKRPFDQRMSDAMVNTTKTLVDESQALVGYTQSDEISLCLYSNDIKKGVFFDGRKQKLVSVLASLATIHFYRALVKTMPSKLESYPSFDARAFTLPNLSEAANVFLWREKDALKNSISMAARAYYSHEELENKSASQLQELLFQKGVNFNDYPAFFKRGTYVKRVRETFALSDEQRAKLPKAQQSLTTHYERKRVRALECKPLGKMVDKEAFLFG